MKVGDQVMLTESGKSCVVSTINYAVDVQILSMNLLISNEWTNLRVSE